MADIGARIRSKREEIGMTQEDLAKILGYKNKSTIAKIENGTNDIVQSKVIEFANALHTTVGYLMGWNDNSAATSSETSPSFDYCLTNEERTLIVEYRNADEASKELVRRVLKYAQLLNLYPDIPDTPEELEKKYPPVGSDNAEGKIG